MNIRELIVPLFLATLFAFGLHFFLGRKGKEELKGEVASGQVYEVKHEPQAVVPLNWDIDFIEKEDKSAELVQFETNYALLTFSTAGAALEKIAFKHGHEMLIDIEGGDRQNKAFLLAFDNKTPYYYILHEKQENEESITLDYSCSFDGGLIHKIFTINKKSPEINLEIKLDKHDARYLKKMRLFFPAPQVTGMKADEICAFVNEANVQSLKIYHKLNEIINKTWRKPAIFGAADLFFVHGMTSDPDNFIYRAAFNSTHDQGILFMQLESSEIKEAGSWRLKFYMGPKQASIMGAVDPRLEQLLNYGILSPLIKVVLLVLNFFYKYIKNYGIAIILLTLLIRLILLPFTVKGQQNLEKSMKSQADLQKKTQYLKQKYHNDPERFRQEQAELIRKSGIGGLAGGCLPLFLQIPVFIVLNRLLTSAIELYHASFLWIPNLSAPDPYYILPVLTGIGFLVSSLSNKKQKQQQFVMYAVALVMGAFMTGLASGVVLFMATTFYLGGLENWLVKVKK